MKKYLILILGIAMLSQYSCDKNTPMIGGYEYIHHTQHQGEKPQTGDKVHFNVELLQGSTLIHSTNDKPAAMQLRAFDSASQPSPIEASLSIMAKGDSLTVFSNPLDDNQIENQLNDQLAYRIVLLDIEPAENEVKLN